MEMDSQIHYIALVHVLSVLYLGFVLTFVLGLVEQNTVRKILRATVRRWIKLIGALFVLGIIVHIISSL